MLGTALAIVSAIAGIVTAVKQYNDSTSATSSAAKSTQLAEDNLALNKDIAGKNYELSKEQFEYQKQLNDLVMQREDTAIQRQVADLKAAGLSPLMAAGGSSANPLTSTNAPQYDMSGINQALGNTIAAYNDAFNRKLQSRQFSLQARAQTAQLYTQIAESVLNQKKIKLENNYLDEKLKWEKEHGFRDYNWQSILTNLVEDYIKDKNPSSTKDNVSGIINDIKDIASESGIQTPTKDFLTYGGLPDTTSAYSHNFDNENYDNNRSTSKLLYEEAKEKGYKMRLRKTDNEKNRKLLYNTDDYLKKHISLENWIKADHNFVKYYLKEGMFENHKKYFE